MFACFFGQSSNHRIYIECSTPKGSRPSSGSQVAFNNCLMNLRETCWLLHSRAGLSHVESSRGYEVIYDHMVCAAWDHTVVRLDSTAFCSFQKNRPTLWCGRDGDGSNLAVRYSQVSKGKMAGWLVLVSQQVVIRHGSTPSN